jgi:hypothetical protein
MKHLVISSAVACLIVCSDSLTQASLISVDFGVAAGNYTTGQGVIGSASDQWNVVNNTSSRPISGSTALTDSNGNATGVAMTYSASGLSGNTASGYYFGGTSLQNLMCDYLFASTTFSTTKITLTLSGLAAGTYDLYLFSGAAYATSPRTGTFTATTSVNTSGLSVTIYNQSCCSKFSEGATYGVLEVTVGSDGNLTITSNDASSGGEVDLCGFQLQSVPEPASAALLIPIVVGFLAYAWRKRRK